MNTETFQISIVCPDITIKTINDQVFLIDSTSSAKDVVVQNSDIYEVESEVCPTSSFKLYDEFGIEYTDFPDNIEFDSTNG